MEEKRLSSDEQERTFFENENLVYYLVKKLGKKPLDSDYEDVISVGKIGLIKAVKKYDQNKGIKFATYASRCINNEIFMYFRKEKKERCISIDEPLTIDTEGRELTLQEILPSDSKSILQYIEEQNTLEEIINLIINVLTKIEREIIKYKIYGKAQKDIGDIFDLSQSYISRIVKNAINKIKFYNTNNIKYKKKYEVIISEDCYKLFRYTEEEVRLNIATVSKLEPDALIRIITIVDSYEKN